MWTKEMIGNIFRMYKSSTNIFELAKSHLEALEAIKELKHTNEVKDARIAQLEKTQGHMYVEVERRKGERRKITPGYVGRRPFTTWNKGAGRRDSSKCSRRYGDRRSK